MKKLIAGLTIMIAVTGCDKNEPPKSIFAEKEVLTQEKLDNTLTLDSSIPIITETSKFKITNDQKIKIDKRIEELKEIKRKKEIKAALKKEKERKEQLKISKRKNWSAHTFVDEFGDPTKDKYIKQKYKNASFSNSATRGALLEGVIIITKDSIRFDSYEYGRKGNNTETFSSDGVIKIKNSRGKILSIPCTESLSVYDWKYDKNYSKFINFLKSSSGNMKILVSGPYSTVHKFEINADGFNWNYKKKL